MKIGIFTDTYYPQVNGVASSVFTLKNNLEKLGHEVHIFTTTDAEVKKGEKNVYRVPSIPVVSERRLGMFYHPLLAKKVKQLNFDIIHTHTEFSLGIFGRMVAKKYDIPMVHTYHTIYENYTHHIVKYHRFDNLSKAVARKISTKFCNSANMLIVPTNKVKNLLLSYGVERNISVIPTGIKLEKFSPENHSSDYIQELRHSLGVKSTDKVILYIGRVSKEKNIEELLIHLQSYLQENDNVKFVLVGDGPTKNDLESLVKELEIENQTIFAGEKPWDTICSYYQIGDVFISASQSETQGLTYIEALAAGLSVVAKYDPCLDGVVENNVNGYTFENKQQFLQALDEILWDNSHKEKLSKGAVQSTERFSEYHFSKNVENFYENVLGMKSGEGNEGSQYAFNGTESKRAKGRFSL